MENIRYIKLKNKGGFVAKITGIQLLSRSVIMAITPFNEKGQINR